MLTCDGDKMHPRNLIITDSSYTVDLVLSLMDNDIYIQLSNSNE